MFSNTELNSVAVNRHPAQVKSKARREASRRKLYWYNVQDGGSVSTNLDKMTD